MRREALEMLVAKVADVTRLDRLVIVGSQSAHGQINWLPGPVLRSIEADFLLPGFGRSSVIDDECGPESDFFAEHGVYADPLGGGHRHAAPRMGGSPCTHPELRRKAWLVGT